MFKRPSYKVPPAVSAPQEDPIARWIAFTGSPELALEQAWRQEQEEDFSPGAVRLMWSPEALLIAASLEDEDIIATDAQPNDAAYTEGDAFEMFIRPFADESYVELHVTPENVHLALRFPKAGVVREAPMEQFTIDPFSFTSTVQVDRIAACWTVAADIPWSLLGLPDGRRGVELLASFSRYDYTEGRPEPVLSSSSPHAECDFHRQQEWAKLVLQA